MRPKESNLDTARGNKRLKIKRKFILAFEGYRTEVQYFKGISENPSKLGIPALIDICPLERYPLQSGSSDPDSMLDILEEYLSFLRSGRYSADLFINTFISDIIPEEDHTPLKRKIEEFIGKAKERLQPLCGVNGLIEGPEKAKDVCLEQYAETFGESKKIVFEVPEPIDYREGRDIVCVIIDRDAESRDSAKCSDFISRCNNYGFRPYITNPCFEMWLLLHFDEVLDEDVKILRLNEKTGGIRYTEHRLDEIVRTYPANEGYRKNCLDFSCFMHRVDNAIRNEKKFCHEIKCIKSEIGSNIGSLIEEMRHDD